MAGKERKHFKKLIPYLDLVGVGPGNRYGVRLLVEDFLFSRVQTQVHTTESRHKFKPHN
jgi:hypothetical protein